MLTWNEATPKLLEKWDVLVQRSCNGTLFHERSFLAYHGKRFLGSERFLVASQGSEPLALMSLAVTEQDGIPVARSPYGGSYGGIVYLQTPNYSTSERISRALVQWFEKKNIHRCTLTLSLEICAEQFMATPIFCLHEQGFHLVSRDVSSIVDLQRSGLGFTSRGRGSIRKAGKNDIGIIHKADIEIYWPIMEDTYQRHGVRPTHEKHELADLLSRLSDRISLAIAVHNNTPVAGIAEFIINDRVQSAFYFCQNDDGARVQALSLLVADALKRARNEGFLYYDFGTSTVGMQARSNIFRFKEGFESQGVFRETLEWKRKV